MPLEAQADIGVALANLRNALLRLKPEGDNGFEGLIAHVLAAFLSRQFRVARAGRQHGRDGATTPGQFDIYFEAKLYSGKPPSTEDLQSKLMSAINAHQPNLDIWAAVSTAALGENSVAEVTKTGEKFGVTVLAVDWSGHPLPPLAALLAASKLAAAEWLSQAAPSELTAITGALELIELHAAFSTTVSEIAASFSRGVVGLDDARAKNAKWLEARFASRLKARQAFGQFVAPNDPSLPSLPRNTEVEKIIAAVSDRTNQIIAVIGDEGVGKTWITSLAWASLSERPIFLLCTTDIESIETAQRDPLRFLAQLLAMQTGGSLHEDGIQHWIRRLENWCKRTEEATRLWLVLDGLNERESRPWIKLIDRLMPLASELGICLFLTSRPTFFRERIRSRLDGYSVREVAIEPFSKVEVEQGIVLHGSAADDLSDDVLEFLRNPRIFSVAVSLLERLAPTELRPERLLFEYWRRRVDERSSFRHSDAEMRALLVSHASAVRDRLKVSAMPVATSFRRELWKQHSGIAQRVSDPTIDDELSEVESGAFFAPDPDSDGTYKLRPASLAYSLGLLLLEELRYCPLEDLFTRLDAAIDPIRGLDLLAEVMLAAFGIACVDDRCPQALAASILHALLGIQNLPDSSANAILAYITSCPLAFIDAAEMLYSEASAPNAREDWLTRFLLAKREHQSVQAHVDAAIRRWLGLWCRQPDHPPQHPMPEDERRKLDDDTIKRSNELERRLSSLTPNERAFLDTHCHEVTKPEQMAIGTLAVELLAGRALAPFADALVAWKFCNGLTELHYTANTIEKQFAWLLRLNPIDARATATALHASLDRLASPELSETGVWATIGTLRSTGFPEDTDEASKLYEKVDRDPARLGSWHYVQNFCDTDPIDPGSADPSNIVRAVEHVSAMDVSKLRAGTWMTRDDHELGDLTPALARFRPDAIVQKLREFAVDLVNRSGEAARFLAFKLSEFSAVLEEADVLRLRAAYTHYVTQPDASERDQVVGAQYLLIALLPHLEVEDQLDAVLELPDFHSEMLDLRRHFKPFPAKQLEQRLLEAERSKSRAVLRRTIFFAAKGTEPLTEASRKVLSRCFNHDNPVIRLLAFEAAAERRDETLLSQLASSNWSAGNASSVATEPFYGSKALSRSPAMYHTVDTLMRMSVGWQSAVVDVWGLASIQRHGDIILEQVRNSLGLPSGLMPDVDVFRNVGAVEQPEQYSFFDSNSRPARNETKIQSFRRLANSDDEFHAEQERKQKAVKAYLATLKKHRADGLVDSANIRGLAALAKRAPQLFSQIVGLFETADTGHLPNIANVMACASIVLSRTDPDGGARLIAKIVDARPDIVLTIGAASIPFHYLAVWQIEDSDRAHALRRSLVMGARDDVGLALQALCAAYAHKQTEVESYAESLVGDDHPGRIARGLTLAGFCDENRFSTALLRSPPFASGFLGHVSDNAKAAYDRNLWARKWYVKMKEAAETVEWWRYSQLMISAADKRFVLWYDPARDFERAEIRQFADFTRGELRDRANKRNEKRKNKLFAIDPPSENILAAWTQNH
jgi:hypothetical protein